MFRSSCARAPERPRLPIRPRLMTKKSLTTTHCDKKTFIRHERERKVSLWERGVFEATALRHEQLVFVFTAACRSDADAGDAPNSKTEPSRFRRRRRCCFFRHSFALKHQRCRHRHRLVCAVVAARGPSSLPPPSRHSTPFLEQGGRRTRRVGSCGSLWQLSPQAAVDKVLCEASAKNFGATNSEFWLKTSL